MMFFLRRAATLVGLAALGTLWSTFRVCAGPGAAFLDPSAFTSLGVFNPTSNVVVDAASGQLSDGASVTGFQVTQAGVRVLVFTFSSFTLDSGMTITFTNYTGNIAFAFLSQSDMTIRGAIDASGYAAGGAGVGGSVLSSRGDGGGGGGYGGAGGPGENLDSSPPTSGGAGGGTYNLDLTAQVDSGSQGGLGAGVGGASGGAGGGALQLAARGLLTVTGSVHVDGAVGGEASLNMPDTYNGSGGGGSGGGLLLQAGNVNIESGAILSANGGNGGAAFSFTADFSTFTGFGGGGGGGGRIVVAFVSSGINNGSIAAAGGGNDYIQYQDYGDGAAGTVIFSQNPQVPALPSIVASVDSSGNLVILWPSSATNYVLQTSPTLGPGAAWNNVVATNVVGNTFVLTNQASGSAGFFRLAIQ